MKAGCKMERILNKVMSFILKNNDLDNDKIEIIRYGLEIVITKLFFIVIILIIGLIMNCIIESVAFAVSLSLLRQYGGGYHADTRKKCLVLSLITLIISLSVIKLAENYQVMILPMCCAAFISFIYILAAAPIDTSNKRFDKDEIRIYGRKSRVLTITFAILSVIFGLLKLYSITFVILTAIITEAYLMLKGQISNYIHREEA